jgi:hypothetical protein
MLALIVLGTVTPMATAQACSCMMPDAARFLAESDFVFAGTLIERPGVEDGAFGAFGAENVPYTFEVDAVYKGDLRDRTVDVWSASNGAACGFEMAIGEPVAIAASLSGGQLTGSLCATFGVDQLEAAAADAGIEPTVPTTPTDRETATEQPDAAERSIPGAAVPAIVAVAVVTVLASAVLRRRDRQV